MRILFVVLLLSAPTWVSAQSVETESRGTYSVPTTDLNLLPYAQFDVPQVRFKVEGERVEIRYPFPKALSGRDLRVELVGHVEADGRWTFRGYPGTLTCHLVDDFRVCVAHYISMIIDKNARDLHIQGLSKSPEELSARLQVAALFGGKRTERQAEIDPLIRPASFLFFDGERIGVLRFPAK